ncbi:MAG TPA: polysaccharide deacetylase family protein [Marinagarivorans sp.]
MRSLLSIHDVMPSTLPAVQRIIDSLPQRCLDKLTVLVVPGLDWSCTQVAQLRAWQGLGVRWAGHGWLHQCSAPRSFYHHLHSRLISRCAAEHLSLSRAQLQQLLADNYQWFCQHHLNPPQVYVPPAWAMGALRLADMASSPFSVFESTSAVIDASRQKVHRLPLVGFEADTRPRAWFLRHWNALNESWARATSTPLRIAIHPNDLQWHLGEQIPRLLDRVEAFIGYDDIIQGRGRKYAVTGGRYHD